MRARHLAAQITRLKGAGGEGGIRTLGTVSGTHDFQSCTFDHSVTSPGLQRSRGARGHRDAAPTCLAESKGFEPLVPLPAHLISNQAPSTTRPALRGGP